MALYDLPLDQLKDYRPEVDEPRDFDSFWSATLSEARAAAKPPVFVPVDAGLETVETYDVSFSGYAGQPIKAWLVMPRNRPGKLPGVVEYIGYGGGRSLPIDWLLWASAGFAHFVMDTRGQGSSWSQGDTPDEQDVPGSPEIPGVMTRGVLDPKTYYYRRLIADAVRAIDTMRLHPAVDPDRIAVTGVSQGGGLTIAAAGLAGSLVRAAAPDVPFLCHYRRAIEVTDTNPYEEIRAYCKIHRDSVETVFRTLSYFDGLSFATRAGSTALFSMGMMDTICPPSTVFAAYNRWAGAKDIRIYPFNDHEGGASFQNREKLAFLKRVLR
jgi:cephalosporin-C deacetylase